MILLDSSIIIDFLRQKEKSKTQLYHLAKIYSLSISTVTLYEVGIGNQKHHLDYWNRLNDRMKLFPVDEQVALAAIDIYKDLKRRNKLIDVADILIAATAIAFDLELATLNLKHFERVPEIRLHKISSV